MTDPHLIVPSNPTPNGDLHLGHIAGPYLGADVLRRAARARGDDAAVLLGTAWQNSHVLQTARRQGREYLDLAAENAGRIEDSFAAAGIGYDVMLRHADIPDIERATRAAFARLRATGAVTVRDASAWYCVECAEWRFQGYVEGRCPHCDSADAYGVDCEGCGLYHDDAALRDARCVTCGTATVLRPLRRAFLDLEPQREWFERYLAEATLGPSVRAFASAALDRPLPSIAVTFVGEVGFPMRSAVGDQRLYPAFELAPRYAVMVARRHGGQPPMKATASMVFGSDNAWERVLLFPAVLRGLHAGADDDPPLPAVLHMSHFYLLDGAKFSTSRGHVVGVRETVAAHGLDTTRLYLAATRPESAPTNFSRAAVAGSPQARAVSALERWTSVPPATIGLDHVMAAAADLDRALRPEDLSCVRAADAVVRLAAAAGTTDPAVRTAALHCLVNGAGALIPETAERLRAAVDVPVAPFDGPPDV